MVTANMSNAVRTVTVERGHDPREFSMIAFGGALGIFAADIARTAGIRRVVIPEDAGPVAASFRQLEHDLVASLRAAGYADDRIDVQWQGDFKFAGQQWELTVPI